MISIYKVGHGLAINLAGLVFAMWKTWIAFMSATNLVQALMKQ